MMAVSGSYLHVDMMGTAILEVFLNSIGNQW